MNRRPHCFSYQRGEWIPRENPIKSKKDDDLDKEWTEAGYKRLFTYGGCDSIEAVDVWRLEKDDQSLPLYLVTLAEDEFGFVTVCIDSLPDLTRFCQEVRGFVLGLSEYINREDAHG